ncbi:MAG TPA: hypothetical protein VM925_18285 [Labilithrix sp.]|nr:hypothetical protein [Labilithrix sp.]
MKKPFIVTVSLMAISACSCGGSSKDKNGGADNNAPGGSSSDAPLTADEKACDEHYKAQLAWVGRCGGLLSDSSSAIARYRKLCARELVAPGAEALRDARAACAARRLTAACDEIIPECDVPAGSLPDGAPCAVRGQCQSRFCKVDAGGCGTCAPLVEAGGVCSLPTDCAFASNEVASCDYKENETTGTCSTWKLVKLGEACGENSFCDTGGHCASEQQEGPGSCVANEDVGGPCVDGTSCVPGLVCLSQKCAARPKEGEACSAIDDCAEGLACNKTCQKIVYVNSGQECDLVRRCERGRCALKVSATDENGKPVATEPPTCVSPIADGEPCGPNDQGLACDYFARCVGGKCVFADPAQCK